MKALGEQAFRSRPSWALRLIMIVSVALHALAGLALLVWSIVHVEELPPPPLTVTFMSAAAPPPPPPPPPPPRKTVVKKPKTTPVEVRQPTEVKPLVQPKEPEKEEKEEPESNYEGEEGGVEGGVKGGVAGGVPGGVAGGVPGGQPEAPRPAEPPPPPRPKTVASFIFDRERISYPDPHLPEWFTNQHPKQTVKGMYRICVKQDGSISDITTLTSLGGADDAIIEQLKSTWRYKPQPLPVCTIRVFQFNIN